MKLVMISLVAAVLISGLGCGGYGSKSNSMATPAATPQISPPGGMYSGVVTVTMSDSMAGAIIYFTTDGTTPTVSSPRYAGPITVTHSMTIQAIAVVGGYQTSAVAAAMFVVSMPMM